MPNVNEGKVVEVEGKKIFSTRDLHLGSTLLVQKFDFLGIDIEFLGNRNQCVGFFKFTWTPALEAEKNRWVLDRVMVPSRSYDNAVRTLKSLVTQAVSDLENQPKSQ
jgi:hypothetical protein